MENKSNTTEIVEREHGNIVRHEKKVPHQCC